VSRLLTLEDALARILARARPLGTESVPVEEAAGRILAASARAATDLPPFASSAMDGFAVRAADTPGRLAVRLHVAAGSPAGRALDRGEAAAIATGGVVPAGADAVVPVEEAAERDGWIEVGPIPAGQYVREAGGDVRAGDEVLAAGAAVGAAQLGALAAAGVPALTVARRPRVAVLATGSELRPPGETLGPGQIHESNGPMLAALLREAGAEVERLPPVADDETAHREALLHGLSADLLVTSGGVSVGRHDLVRSIERELGVEEVFWGVAVRPGKPLLFGTRGATLVFGLPGNPVSSLVSALLFVRPAVLALQGAADPGPRFEHGLLAAAAARRPERDELLRVRAVPGEEGTRLEPVTGQDSHMIVRGAAADALALVPRGTGELPPGTAVPYLRF
jgi:molybdopterin molybdotransferase